MDSEKEEIARYLSDEVFKERTSYEDVSDVINEVVDVDRDYPIEHILSSTTGARSRKPSNIDLSLNIEEAITLFCQIPAFQSGDQLLVFGAVAALCGVVSRKTKIQISTETGFVYYVAYNNRHKNWEIPEQELIQAAISESESVEAPIHIDESVVENSIKELLRINAIQSQQRDGKTILVLRETCSGNWK